MTDISMKSSSFLFEFTHFSSPAPGTYRLAFYFSCQKTFILTQWSGVFIGVGLGILGRGLSMGLGKFLGKKNILFVLVICTLCVQWATCVCALQKKEIATSVADYKKHPLCDIICDEIDNLKENNRQQTYFLITSEKTPQLFNFLVPTIQHLCVSAKITTNLSLLLMVGSAWTSYNVRTRDQCIILGENFLKLFLHNEYHANGIFSMIAHELGHVFYNSQQNFEKCNEELLADEFAVKITQNGKQLETALTLATLALHLFDKLNDFLSQNNQNNQKKLFSDQNIADFVIKIIHCQFPLIRKTITSFVGNKIPSDQIFALFFEKALSSLRAPVNLQNFEQELIQALKNLCSNKSYIKKIISCAAMKVPTTHQPLYERIRFIRNFGQSKAIFQTP